MKLPVQVTFKNLPPSPALESLIRERAATLDTYCPDIMSCRVVVEMPHRHRHSGNPFQVRIDLTVPGDEIVVSQDPTLHGSLQDLGVGELNKTADIQAQHTAADLAVRDAFDAARRQLQDYVRQKRGSVKTHEAPSHGQVVRLGQDEGWILTPDNREVYFHHRSVLDAAFDELRVGTDVAFVEEQGEKGPQASTVRVLGKHHYP